MNPLRFLPLWILLLPAVALAEPDGKVLLAIGPVTLLRAGVESPLKAGAELMSGDTVRTGEAARAQLRLSDESMISLRPLTEFRIDEYRYAGRQDGTEAAFFTLIKGGLRTVAGLVGSVNRDRYAMHVPTATIGRRGSAYTVVDCRGTCFEADGARAPDGTYGSVAAGRVAATNDAGEKEFGVGEAFYVRDFNTLARLLPASPAFLSEGYDPRRAVLPPPDAVAPGLPGFRSGEAIRRPEPAPHPHQ